MRPEAHSGFWSILESGSITSAQLVCPDVVLKRRMLGMLSGPTGPGVVLLELVLSPAQLLGLAWGADVLPMRLQVRFAGRAKPVLYATRILLALEPRVSARRTMTKALFRRY